MKSTAAYTATVNIEIHEQHLPALLPKTAFALSFPVLSHFAESEEPEIYDQTMTSY